MQENDGPGLVQYRQLGEPDASAPTTRNAPILVVSSTDRSLPEKTFPNAQECLKGFLVLALCLFINDSSAVSCSCKDMNVFASL